MSDDESAEITRRCIKRDIEERLGVYDGDDSKWKDAYDKIDWLKSVNADLLAACEAAEKMIGFYEGCEQPEIGSDRPTVRIEGKEIAALLAVLRPAIGKAKATA